jgi:hypothetical protein
MIAKTIILTGLILIMTGIILLYFPKLFNWFGNLPGDIKIINENNRIYIPLGSMLLISIILTAVFNIIRWILSR